MKFEKRVRADHHCRQEVIYAIKVKKTLDEMGWSVWLVIECSRDAKKPSDTKYNYGANTAFEESVSIDSTI